MKTGVQISVLSRNCGLSAGQDSMSAEEQMMTTNVQLISHTEFARKLLTIACSTAGIKARILVGGLTLLHCSRIFQVYFWEMRATQWCTSQRQRPWFEPELWLMSVQFSVHILPVSVWVPFGFPSHHGIHGLG